MRKHRIRRLLPFAGSPGNSAPEVAWVGRAASGRSRQGASTTVSESCGERQCSGRWLTFRSCRWIGNPDVTRAEYL
jgi:hypothetical protein